MRIDLMGDVEDKLVFGRIEHIVHGDGGLHEAEVRAYVSTVE